MRIPVAQKSSDLESWLNQLQKKVSELKPDNEEVQTKLKELQISLEQAIKNQAIQQQSQVNCQKQIALLRSQIDTASDAKSIQPLEEKIQQLESDLTLLKAKPVGIEIATPLKAMQEELSTFKKSTEQFAKINISLRAQLQGVIETSDRQAQQLASWQNELAQQTQQQETAINELQIQLSQTKVAFSKRLNALEGRVSGLEVKHEYLSTKVKGQDPEITVAQKLLKLRQAILEDKYISAELKYYVAPNGEAQPGLGDHEALFEWTQANFLDAKAEARVLLLQGQAGAGKSTFNRFLLKHLWQDKAWETFQAGDKAPLAYVPIFIPLGSPQINSTALLKYLADLPELTEDFTDAEVNILKRDYRLLLIADGYDEMPGRQALNLYDVNQFDQYHGRIKLLIGCRTQRAQELDETTLFVPHDSDGKPLYFEFKRRHVSPFNDEQIRDYLTKYLAQNKDRTDITLWKEVEEYEVSFARLPELKALITTPFLLLMSIEILPIVIAETTVAESKESKTTDTEKLTRAKLYDYFMDNWFKRQAEKTRKAGDTTSPKLLIQQYRQFCLKFAERLRAAGITSVQYPYGEEALFDDDLLSDKPKIVEDPQGPRGPWVEKLLGVENKVMLRARSGAPLLIGTGNYYQFIHASLLDYFLTTAIADQARNEVVPAAPMNSMMQKLEVKSEPAALPEAESSSTEVLLSHGLLTKDQIGLLADRVRGEPKLKEILFQFIEHSKKEEGLSQVAANAITVLNANRVSFSGMDFKGIRIPGADLSYAVLDSTQLQGADLRQVTLTGAWLQQTNFSQSQMTDTQWGEWPSLILPSSVNACVYSHDGRWLAVGCGSNVYLYDVKTRKLEDVFKKQERENYGYKGVAGVAFDARDECLATACGDKTIRLWDFATGRLESKLDGHTDDVECVAFDAQGERMAYGCGKTVHLRQIKTGKLERALEGHTGSISSITFDRQGKRLASAGSWDNTVCLWEVTTGKLEHTLMHTNSVKSVAFDVRGERLASGNNDSKIYMWEVATGKLERTLQGHTGSVYSVAFDTRGECLASGSHDTTVRLWEVTTGKLMRTLEGHTGNVMSVTFDGQSECLASGSWDKTVRLWRVETGKLERIPEGHTNSVFDVTFDGIGEHLVSRSKDNVCKWQVATGQLQRILVSIPVEIDITSFAYDVRGERLAFGYWDGSVVLWDIMTNKLLRTFKGHTSSVNSVAFDERGERLASGSYDKTVCLWNLAKGRLERTLQHDYHISRVAFSASGERLASSVYGTINLWEVATGRLEHTLKGRHQSPVNSIAFDVRGERLASGGDDSIVCLWSVATGEWERTLKGHDARIQSVAFDAQGERLASGSDDNTVRLWQVATGACLAVIQGFIGYVFSVSWKTTPLGNFLATGSSDKAVRCWQVEDDKGEKDKIRVTLRWTSHQAALTAHNACIDGVIGLDEASRDLLQQRGAKGTPAEFKSTESQKASSSPVRKDSTDIRGLAAPATRLGLLAAPAATSQILTSAMVETKAMHDPKQ